MILLNTHKLEKGFSGRTLFREVSFGIGEGERIGLVGPNGAGKSTLIKILAGLTEADSGNVSRKRGLRIGFMDQTPTFSEGATVMSSILEKLEDPNEGIAKAMQIIAHLNLGPLEDRPVDELSGGWRKRVALARELATEPELLLLDEPTNHLDVSGILWLEEYLRTAPYAVMMITHDRLFLQRVATRILDLDPRNPNHLLSVNGDYAMYVEAKEHELKALQRHEKVQRNQLRREVEWLSRGSIARQTKQSARIEAAGELKESVEALKAQNRPRALDIEFGQAEHSPQKLMDAEGLKKGYEGRVLFEKLNLLITKKTRIALLGDNGCGKSTLIKILIGQEKPDAGTIKRADPLVFAHFEQNRDTLDYTKSVLKNLCPEGDYVHVQGQAMHVRSYLDRFLFPGIKAELPVSKLSGGEQARLRLAQLMMQSSQVLVLDEPTNDLDTDTLEVLEGALQDYNGAVILVTHDRYFMDAVADHILAFPPNELENPNLEKFASYFQWETWYREQTEKVRQKLRAKTSASSGGEKKTRMSFKEKFELENMEGEIQKLEAEVERLTGLSQDGKVLADHKKLNEILKNLGQKQTELEKKYARWQELEAKK